MEPSVQIIYDSLIAAYQKDSEEITKYFHDHPDAIKLKKGKNESEGPTCSVLRDPKTGKLLLIANENLLENEDEKLGKREHRFQKKYGDVGLGTNAIVKYALDIETQELCVVKMGLDQAPGYTVQETEHATALKVGIIQPGFDSFITRKDGGALEDKNKYYTVLRYLGKPLSSFNMHEMAYPERLKIIGLIFQKIKMLHDDFRYTHGDLHSGNITVECDSQGRVVDVHLIDLGNTRNIDTLRLETAEVLRQDDYRHIAGLIGINFREPERNYLLTDSELKALINNNSENVLENLFELEAAVTGVRNRNKTSVSTTAVQNTQPPLMKRPPETTIVVSTHENLQSDSKQNTIGVGKLKTILDTYKGKSTAKFWSTPPPEIVALRKLCNSGKESFTRDEIVNEVKKSRKGVFYGSAIGSKSHRAELITNPGQNSEDKTGASAVLKEIGRFFRDDQENKQTLEK